PYSSLTADRFARSSPIVALFQRKREELVGRLVGAAGVAAGPATGEIGRIADHRTAEAMPRAGQRRELGPLAGLRIEALLQRERLAILALATGIEDETAVIDDGASAARLGQGRCTRPCVGRRIIDIVERRVVGGLLGAAADDMDLAVDRDNAGMVARHRQRR